MTIFNDLLAGLSDPILALDAEGNVVYLNSKAIELLVSAGTDLPGKNFWQIFDALKDGAFYKACSQAITSQERQVIAHSAEPILQGWGQNIIPSGKGLLIIFFRVTAHEHETYVELRNKRLFHALIEHNEGIIALIDEQFNFIFRSETGSRITGWTDDDYRSQDASSNIHPDYREYAKKAVGEAIRNPGKQVPVLFKMKHKDGHYLWLEGVFTSKLDDYAVGGILVNLRDVTDRIEAEAAIAKLNERFLLAATATNDMIWDWDLATDELWWNYNYNAIFGYNNDSPVHHISMWVENVHPDDRDRVKEAIYKVINSGQKYWSDEYRYRKKNGEYMNIYDRGYVSYDESGKPYRMIGSMLDITERIHAQEELKCSEEKYRTLVEQASDAIYITSTDGRILTVNPSACKLSGYTEEEIMKMNVMDFIFSEDLEKNPFRISELKEGKTVVVERRFKVKDNRILHVECIANMLSDERILVFARDIGERIKAEALLKKSYEDIRNLASHLVKVRDEERRRIGREIHDELGQQLTAIKMDVAWVEKKIPEEIPQVKAKLKNMITLLDGSNKSVRKILKELTPAIIDDNGLLAALETQNRQFTELTGIAIDFHTNRKKITIGQEVANCIFRVYQESLTNIMKYANASRVVTSLDTSDTQVAVSVQDNGAGFDSLAFAKSNDKKSFGIIGMKERVLSLGGDFNLESIPGKGTTIVAHIPYNQA